MIDPYSILGVAKNATPDDIKKAYRKLAAVHHPDKGGSTEKFQEIQGAYAILSDPQRREEFDNPPQQMGAGAFNFNMGGGFPQGFEDIFGSFFGRRPAQQPQRNKTFNLQAEITLEDAFNGKDILGNVRLPSGEQTFEIKIPPGIRDGNVLRLSGMGDNSNPELPKGDIHLAVRIQPHAVFQRHNDDLVMNLTINALEAIIGKTVSINTIENKTLEIKINPGVQYGQTLAVHGHGMPNINDTRMRGRLLINVEIIIPTNLTDDQKEIIKQILQ
jgi:curved DNA-binding protein